MGNSKCANCTLEEAGHQPFMAAILSYDRGKDCVVQVNIATVLDTVFEHGIQLNENKNKISKPESLKMCCQCSSVLAELYKLYVQFLKLTKHNSHVQSLIKQSLQWEQDNSSLDTGTGSIPNDTSAPLFEVLVKVEEEILVDDTDEESEAEDPLPSPSLSESDEEVEDSKHVKMEPQGPSKPKSSRTDLVACLECGLKIQKRQLWRHQQKKHPKNPLTCPEPECGQVCPKEHDLAWHLLVAHGIGEKVTGQECSTCSKYFPSIEALKKHSRYTHVPEADKVQCPLCHRKLPTAGHLKSHIRKDHEDTAEGGFKCDLCDKIYKTRSGVRSHHLRAHNPNAKVYKCKICGESSTGAHFLVNHQPCPLIRQRNIKCDQCDKTFYKLQLLNTHVRNIHEGTEHCVCSECGDKFTRKCALKRHVEAKHSKSDETAGPYVCETCGKSFKVQDYLRQHKRSKTHGGVGHGLYVSSSGKKKTAKRTISPVNGSNELAPPKQ